MHLNSISANKNRHSSFGQTINFSVSMVIGLLLAVVPKCPLCWGIYLSVCGAGAINLFSYQQWTAPILALLLVFNVGATFHYAHAHRAYGPFLMTLLGALIITGGIVLCTSEGTLLGIFVLLIGSVSGVYAVLRSNLKRCCSSNRRSIANSATNYEKTNS
jgi:hypothetical protein